MEPTERNAPAAVSSGAPGSPKAVSVSHIPGHRRFFGLILTTLALTTLLMLLGKYVERATEIGRPTSDLLYLSGSILLGASSIYCFSRAYRTRIVTVLVAIASGFIITTPLLDVLESIPFFAGLSFFSAPAKLRSVLGEGYLMGIAVLLFAVYLSLFEALRARHLLELERARVVREAQERQRVEHALMESEDKYRLVFDRANDGIALFTTDMRPDLMNDRAIEMSGYTREEVARIDPRKLVHPDDWDLMVENNQRRLAGEDFERTYEFRMMRKDGAPLPVEGTFDVIRRGGDIVGIQAIYRDISSRKRAEAEREHLREKLLEDRRLESLGILAGGVAHDFNNLLMGILGNCSLAASDVPPDSRAHESVEEIRAAAQRAADLSRQMLAYSGRGRIVVKPLHLHRLVREMTPLLEVTAGEGATIHYELDPDSPQVKGDASQLRQMVLDLVENAAEALGDEGGGITIAVGQAEVSSQDLDETFRVGDVSPGTYAFVEVRDSGHGIPKDRLDRIFDPFYTTRFVGRGLGLASVSGIVRGHKGAVFVSSSQGQGTSFRVVVPCSNEGDDQMEPHAAG